MPTLQKQPLESTILDANKKSAEAIANGLLAMNPAGKNFFTKEETEHGFCVRMPMLNDNNEKKRCKCLEWEDINGRKKFYYDPRVVVIK